MEALLTALPPTLELAARRILHYVEESRMLMGWVDLLDILLVGALLSIAFVWLQRRTARAILFALVPSLVIFLAAKTLKMYMTSLLFQFGLIAVFVCIVVIFQDDFRRAFESLAVWRPWGRGKSIHAKGLADLLVECLSRLAEDRCGALIVLQGRESIEPHLRAGIPLHGRLSVPLLLSIFDTHSPGHDGGVTIHEGKVAMFGVHLPLSRNAADTGRLGTRHAAALGLAEKCDALILVVSEETGTISIAREGKLRPAKSTKEIRDLTLKQFHLSGPVALHRALWEIPWLRLSGSMMLAMILWLGFARPTELVLRTVEAPIVYRGLPKGWEAKPPEPMRAKLTLFGPEGPVMQVDPSALAVTVELLRIAEGQQRFVLSDSDVTLPARVRVKRIEPREVTVQAYPIMDIELPVSVMWLEAGGRGPASHRIRMTPPMATLRVPRAATPPRQLETEPVDARELKQAGRLKVKLRVPPDLPVVELPTPEVEIVLEGGGAR